VDIDSRGDLYKVVQLFYQKLFDDDDMKPFFIKFYQQENLEKHLNVLVDFWDSVLFHSGVYTKNAMQPHFIKHKETPFKKIHFEKWILLFCSSIDELFTGQNAEVIKNRAQSIATVMQLKILNS
jgi:hemoglobin